MSSGSLSLAVSKNPGSSRCRTEVESDTAFDAVVETEVESELAVYAAVLKVLSSADSWV